MTRAYVFLLLGLGLTASPVVALDLEVLSGEPLEFDLATSVVRSAGEVTVRYGEWVLRTGSLAYNPGTGTIELSGGAEVRRVVPEETASGSGASAPIDRATRFLNQAEARGEADTITYATSTGEATMEGTPSVYTSGAILHATNARYFEKKEELLIDEFSGGNGIVTVVGESATVTASSAVIRNGVLFKGEPGFFSPQLHAAEIRFNEDQTVAVRRVRATVGPIPVFWLPNASFRPGAEGPVEFQVDAGYNNELGANLHAEPRIHVTPNLTLGPFFDIYTKRGFLLAPSAFWNGDSPNNWITLETGWIKDQGDLVPTFQGEPTPEDRYFVNLRALRAADRSHHGIVQITPWSDEEVIRDFRDEWYDRYVDPTNFAEAEWHRGSLYVLGFGSFRTNEFQNLVTEEPLAEAGWLPTPLGTTGVLAETRLRGDRLVRREAGIAQESANQFLWDAALSRPFRNGAFLLRPLAAARYYAIQQNEPVEAETNGLAAEIGFDAAAVLTGRFDFKSRAWKIDGLVHELRPVLGLRYRPGIQEEDLNPFDPDDVYLSGAPPLSLRSERGAAVLQAEEVLRVGIENRLATGEGDERRELLRWHVYQDLEASLPDETDHRLSLYQDFEVNPAPWLRYRAFSNFDTRSGSLREWTNDLTIRDGWKWDAALESQYLDDRLEQYGLRGRYRVGERDRVGLILRFDGRTETLTEQRYVWEREIGGSWVVSNMITLRDGNLRQSDIAYRIKFSLVAF